MSRPVANRLLATTLQSLPRPRVVPQSAPQWLRTFSQTTARRADDPFARLSNPLRTAVADGESAGRTPAPPRPAGRSASMQDLVNLTMGQASAGAAPAKSLEEMAQKLEMPEEDLDENNGVSQYLEPYHFHIYSHKHNCHVTVTRPNRDAIISASCGNLGFKKSQRKSYDAAYQLGNYVVDKLHQMGYHKKIKQMEVVLRGFGAGREAVTKVLMGSQGKLLRTSIVRVSDNTRLKFGGTRSKNPRRLG